MALPSQANYLASVEEAAEVVAVGMSTVVDDDAATRAATGNVRQASFLDYAEGMTNYEARTDVEPLAQRRARLAGTTFASQDFARADTYDGGFSA